MNLFSKIILLIFIIILEYCMLNVYCLDMNYTIACSTMERRALLKFRASLWDPSGKLSSWAGANCCEWSGVDCDENSGHVNGLHLSNDHGLNSEKLHGKLLDPSLSELKYLTYLDLDQNDFGLSPIPEFLGSLKYLESMNLGQANFSGPIPSSVGNLSSLKELFLYENKLSGEIPISLGQLSNLEILDLDWNLLDGVISEAHLSNLSNLAIFSVENNPLKLRIRSDWTPPFQLKGFAMSSCEIVGGKFPDWLQTQYQLHFVTFSNCSLSDTLPKWAYNSSWTELHLAHNKITGPIPQLSPILYYLNMSNNLISGPLPTQLGQWMPGLRTVILAQNFINGTIPDSLCQIKSLYYLDLSKNNISGNIQNCNWGNLPELAVLKLSSNHLSGDIPKSIAGAYSLKWLHLNHNSFTGEIQSSLRNLTQLWALDIGDNMFSGELPGRIGLDLLIIRARNNNFSGEIPIEFCKLSKLQIMDLADSRLSGEIPNCFGNLSAMVENKCLGYTSHTNWGPDCFNKFDGGDESLIMVIKGLEMEYTTSLLVYLVNLDLSNNKLIGEIPDELTNLRAVLSLNLSHNHFTGKIPGKIGDMKSLESLDFSRNNLFGKIPESLSELNSLSHLNLSYSNFSGKIPTGRQLQTLDSPWIYDGNPLLCGSPLMKACSDDDDHKKTSRTYPNDEEKHNDVAKIWFYGVVASGFATGFWGFIGVLVWKRSWRHAYFEFVEVRLAGLFGA